MFQEFHDTLQQWLHDKEYISLIESILHPAMREIEHSPNNEILWTHYLKEIIPSDFAYLFFANQQHSSLFIRNLLSFASYTVEYKVRKLVEESVLKYMAAKQKDLLIDQLLNFHYQLEKWINGFWHEQIIADRFSAFHNIKKSLKFKTNWNCATFLSGCGYFYPFSKTSYNIWLKWSGEISVDDGYEIWLKLLKKVDADHLRMYYIDRLLSLVFSKDSTLTELTFCQQISSCYSCPLKEKCQFFGSRFQDEQINILENLIRENRLEEAKTDELIVFLNRGHWQGTEEHKRSVEKFPNLSFSTLTETSVDSDDEKLIFFLLVLQELMSRTKNKESVQSKTVFSNSREIYNAFKNELCRKQQESFNTLILDNKHRKIDFRLITKGTLNQSLVHPREVFAPAIQLRAAAIVLVHNHPSGDPKPSTQDINVTKRLCEVADIVGIKILDHIIMGRDSFFSFVDEDLI